MLPKIRMTGSVHKETKVDRTTRTPAFHIV